MKEKSWLCTLITQLSLCAAAYIALNIGQPQNQNQKLTHGRRSSFHIYFITVNGGFTSLQQQTLLLQQMVKVKKICDIRFVIDISELGESEPLLQNATVFPELRNMPWYTCGNLRRQGETYSVTKIEIPHGQTLDIIALDTVLFQDPSSARGNDQIMWLRKTLNESNSDWKIVVGFDPLISFESLHSTLLHYGADAYMSTKTCDAEAQGLYITAFNHNSISKEETVNGFLLHRVSSMEMVTFAVKLTGEVERKLSFRQRGRSSI
ncbi:hypothetical protein ACP275_10G129500 [Erythranthe tilingii]